MDVILEAILTALWIVIEAAGVLGTAFFATEAVKLYRNHDSYWRDIWLIAGLGLFSVALAIMTLFGALFGISLIFGVM